MTVILRSDPDSDPEYYYDNDGNKTHYLLSLAFDTGGHAQNKEYANGEVSLVSTKNR